MRSTKSRSRSKANRNRSIGNIVNRVFDSSGPEGKVRGTPQQIIDKYNQLARDAQLSNDRVAAENFLQHAEHYLRLLAEAQRDMDARREQAERENRERQLEREKERAEKDNSQNVENAEQPIVEKLGQGQSSLATIDNDQSTSSLVETPENSVAHPTEERMPVVPSNARNAASEPLLNGHEETAVNADTTVLVEPEKEEKPKPKRRRAPRKPKVVEATESKEGTIEPPAEA